MTKKTPQQISEYYKQKSVVTDYLDRRFKGIGGKYIHQVEVQSILNNLKIIEFTKRPQLIKVLDIGAGSGRLSFFLKAKGYNTYCLDSSEAMIKILSRKISKNHIFLQSIFDKMKTPIKFNVICSLRFFDHFNYEDQEKILSNIKHNLASDGYIILTALNSKSLENLLSNFFPYGRYNFYYSDVDFKKLLTKLKLKIILRNGHFFIPRGVFIYSQKIPFITYLLIFIDTLLSKILPSKTAYFTYLLQKE